MHLCIYAFIQLVNDITGAVIPKEETAAYINDYFANIGQDLFSKLPQTGLMIPDPVIDNDEEELDLEDIVNVDVVKQLVDKINIDKSCGLKDVNSRVVKDAMSCLIPEITLMFKNSLKLGVFPVSWSKGLLIPIPKKGNLTNIKNWQVSRMCLEISIFEKMCLRKLGFNYSRWQGSRWQGD